MQESHGEKGFSRAELGGSDRGQELSVYSFSI